MQESITYKPLKKSNTRPGSLSGQCGEMGTQTIDLNDLFSGESVAETGTFDLRSIESTSLGKLLDALPMPACLIDQWYCVVFSNQAWRKNISAPDPADYGSFLDLLPRPAEEEKAKNLELKAEQLLDKAFETRKPQQAEAIFELKQRRMWSRLHLRAVRILSQRHLLCLIEDITAERTRQRLAQREVNLLRKSLKALEKRVQDLTGQVGKTGESCDPDGR